MGMAGGEMCPQLRLYRLSGLKDELSYLSSRHNTENERI